MTTLIGSKSKGPGGDKFGDYWRMGLPLEVIGGGVAAPLILLFWPSAR